MSTRVAVVGSYVQDHCWRTDRFPLVGETRVGHFSTGPGGKGFNQAVAAHRQGVATRFIGAVGCDPLAATARGFAAEAGLDCDWHAIAGQPTATSSIVVDAQGRNLIVVDLAANLALDAEHAAAAIPDSAQVVLVQLETALATTAAALRRAREIGALALLNPAPLHPELSPELLHSADIATPNETEFALLLARLGIDADLGEVWQRSDAELHALARRSGVPTLVITLGAYGCFVSHGSNQRGDAEACYRVAPEDVQAIDTTGAGDAFSGALAAALCFDGGRAFREAIVHANRVAALSTERPGTAPAMPTLDEVRARFGG